MLSTPRNTGTVTHMVGMIVDELLHDPLWLLVSIVLPVTLNAFAYLFFGSVPFVLMMLPWFIPFAFFSLVSERVRARFWKEVAHSRGWLYLGKGVVSEEDSALFLNQGHTRVLANQVVAEHEAIPVRIFESAYTLGEGKQETTHQFTAYAFRFTGTFPHCYLNRKSNEHNFAPDGATRVPLPGAFEDVFELYVPQKYEVEALQIFTPDILEHLLVVDWPFDLELVARELVIFRAGRLGSYQEFDTEYLRAKALAERLSQSLHRATFTPVGNMPHLLREVKSATSWLTDPISGKAYEQLLLALLTVLFTLTLVVFGWSTPVYPFVLLGILSVAVAVVYTRH